MRHDTSSRNTLTKRPSRALLMAAVALALGAAPVAKGALFNYPSDGTTDPTAPLSLGAADVLVVDVDSTTVPAAGTTVDWTGQLTTAAGSLTTISAANPGLANFTNILNDWAGTFNITDKAVLQFAQIAGTSTALFEVNGALSIDGTGTYATLQEIQLGSIGLTYDSVVYSGLYAKSGNSVLDDLKLTADSSIGVASGATLGLAQVDLNYKNLTLNLEDDLSTGNVINAGAPGATLTHAGSTAGAAIATLASLTMVDVFNIAVTNAGAQIKVTGDLDLAGYTLTLSGSGDLTVDTATKNLVQIDSSIATGNLGALSVDAGAAPAIINVTGGALTATTFDLATRNLELNLTGGTFAASGAVTNAQGTITKTGSFKGTLDSLTLSAALLIDVQAGQLEVTTNLALASKDLDLTVVDSVAGTSGFLVAAGGTTTGALVIEKNGTGTAELGDLSLALADAGGATFTVNDGLLKVASLDLNQTNLILDVADSKTFEVVGVTKNTGSTGQTLTKNGLGTAKLGAFQLDAADTLLASVGITQLGDQTLSAATVTVAADATLRLDAGATGIAELTSGAGKVVINGKGANTAEADDSLRFGALQSVSGANELANLQLGSDAIVSVGAGSLTVAALDLNSKKLILNVADDAAVTSEFVAAGATQLGATITKNLAGTAEFQGTVTLPAALELVVNGGSLTFDTLDLAGFDLTANVTTSAAGTGLTVTTTDEAKIITKQGAGTADLGDTTLKTGIAASFTVTDGTLKTGDLDLNDSELDVIVESGKTFEVTGITTNTGGTGNTLTKNGLGTAKLGAFQLNTDDTLAVASGVAQLGDLTLSSATVTVTADATLSLDSGVGGVAHLTSGAGKVTINGKGSNTAEPDDSLRDGALRNIAGDNILDNLKLGSESIVAVQAGTLTITDLDLNGKDLILNVADDAVAATELTVTNSPTNLGAEITKNLAGVANFAGTVTLPADFTVDVNAGQLKFNNLDLASKKLTIEVASAAIVPGFAVTTATTNALTIQKDEAGTAELGATTLAAASATAATFTVNDGTLKASSLDLAATDLNLVVANGKTFEVTAGFTNNNPAGTTGQTLTKTGTGTAKLNAFQLNADDTLSVNAGIVELGSATNSAATVIVANRATLDLNTTPANGLLSGEVRISGSGNVAVTGKSAALVNTSGDNRIDTLYLDDVSTVQVNGGSLSVGTFDLDRNDLFIGGPNDFTSDFTVNAANITKRGANLSLLGTVNLGATSKISVVEGILAATSIELDAYNLEFGVSNGALAGVEAILNVGGGASVLTKTGTGTLILGNIDALDLDNLIELKAGVLSLETGAAASSSAAINVLDGGTLQLDTAKTAADVALLTGLVTINGSSAIDNLAGDNRLASLKLSGSAGIALSADSLTVTTLDLNGKSLALSGAGDFASTLTSNASDISKSGTGEADLGDVTLGSASTLALAAGTLTIGSLDQAGKALVLDIAGGTLTGGFDIDNAANITKQGVGSADLGIVTLGSASVISHVGGNLDIATLDLDGNSATLNVGNGRTTGITSLDNSGASATVTKTGTGTASIGDLGGLNATDGLAVASGTVLLGGSAASTASASVTVSGGATLELDTTKASADTALLTGLVTLSGTGIGGTNGALLNTDGDNKLSSIALAGAATVKVNGGSLTADAANLGKRALTLDGTNAFTATTVTDAGDITKNGSGSATLTNVALGANSTITVAAGTLTVDTIEQGTKSLTLDIDGAFTDGAVINNAANLTKDGSATVNLDTVNLGANSVITLAQGALNIGDLNANGKDLTLDIGAGLTLDPLTTDDVGNITKSGAGTAILGAVSLSKDITVAVNQGTLDIASIDQNSQSLVLDVATGATLAADIDLTDAGDLTKRGLGSADIDTVTLSTDARIKVEAGSLTITSVDLNSKDLTLEVASSGTFAAGTALTDIGNLTKEGSGSASVGATFTGPSSSITVSGGSLTLGNIQGAITSLTLDVASAASFSAGETGGLTNLTKNGAGTAIFTLAKASLTTVAVNAGVLQFNGAEGTITKSGTGTLLINGGTLAGGTSLDGATTLTGEIKITGAVTSASNTLGTGSNLIITSTGNLTGDVIAQSNSVTNVESSGTLTGNVTASSTSEVFVSGTVAGKATLSDDAQLNVLSGGSLGTLEAGGRSEASVSGTVTGVTTLSGYADLHASGTLLGALGANDRSSVTITGTAAAVTLNDVSRADILGSAAAVAVNDDATLTVLSGATIDSLSVADDVSTGAARATATVSGTVTNASTLTGDADLQLFGTLGGLLTATGTSSATISGDANGGITLGNTATADITSTGSAGAVTFDGDSTLTVSSGATVASLAVTDTSATSNATVAGTVTGTSTLRGDADLQVSGTLTGLLTALNTSSATVSGAANGGITLGNTATAEVTSTGTAGAVTFDGDSTLTVSSGATVASLAVTDTSATSSATVAGTVTGTSILRGDADLQVSGALGGLLTAQNTSSATISGTAKGVTVSDTASLDLLTGAVLTGNVTAQNGSTAKLNGTVNGNVIVSGTAVLSGSGTITGNVTITGGTHATGNSPGVQSIGGNYSLSNASSQIEIGGTAGAGVNPNGHDAVQVAGTVTLGANADLNIVSYLGFEAARGDSFQVYTSSDSNATRGKFSTLTLNATNRVLFDHSSGKAYGTGLNAVAGQTFAAYATNANQAAIATALWNEGVVAGSFIQTSGAGVQLATDLGAAVVALLTSADASATLDALSPEAYAGIAELGVRSARSFSQISSAQRRHADKDSWDFSIGYSGEQVDTNGSSSAFTNYKLTSRELAVTASRDLAADARLTLAAGTIDGNVKASGFNADTDTQAFGAGVTLMSDSKAYAVDLGLSVLSTDWNANRNGAQTSQDGQSGLGASIRLTKVATTDGALSYSPYVGLSYAKQEQGAVAESAAAGGVGAGFAAYDRNSVVGELGIKAEYALQSGATLTGVAAWEHEFKDEGATTLDAEFTDTGAVDSRFSVKSPGIGADLFRIGLGIRTGLGENSSLSLSYEALFSDQTDSGHAIRADVSFRF